MMRLPPRGAPAAAVLLFSLSAGAAAQEIDEIQIAPVTVTMTVGEQRTLLATPYDRRGNPLLTAAIEWRTLNPEVVEVSFDPASSNVATVTAIGVGTAPVEAFIGAVTSRSVIQVQAAAPAPAEAAPDSVLPDGVSSESAAGVARMQPVIFASTPSCRMATLLENNLLVTTYTAIRGAESVRVTMADGRRIDNARVAARDTALDVAVLHVPEAAEASGLSPGDDPEPSDWVWAIGQPGCTETAPATTRVRRRTAQAVELTDEMPAEFLGAPVVDREGRLVAIVADGRNAIPVQRVTALLTRAQAAAAAGTTVSVGDVARQENHRYGSVAFRSDATGARARIRPREPWHWAGLAAEGALPLTFVGPQGRYTAELLSGGRVVATQDVTIRPGARDETVLAAPVVAEPAPAVPPEEASQIGAGGGGGGGGFPVAILVVGLAAVGGGAFLLAGGGDDGGPGPGPGPGPETGGIRIVVPIP